MARSGAQLFLDMLSEFGVDHLFANPGSTELPLNDLLVKDDRFHYTLGLHEVPVMAMADGYAMASRSLGVVNLHICCGLGNAMGMLYNAYREGSPLLVTAGQQDQRLLFEEPVLAGDMISVAKPWTKWAVEVRRVEDMPSAIRRAIQIAMTPPTGPVFMSLPLDVQMDLHSDDPIAPVRLPDFRVRPPIAAVEEATELMAQSLRPVILAGSRVTERRGVESLVKLAEHLGAPVFYESATSHGRSPFPADHQLNTGPIGTWSPDVLKQLEAFDLLVVVGVDFLRQYIHHEPPCPIPTGLKLVQIDESAWQINKNYQVDAAVFGDIQHSLIEVATKLDEKLSVDQRTSARKRTTDYGQRKQQQIQSLKTVIDQQETSAPLTPHALMGTLARGLPDDIVVVEEAVTTTQNILEQLGVIKNPENYFGHRGWALGWGIGCTLGVKLAWPNRPVIGIIGDGSTMYGIQGLWTAAKYNIPVTLIVCNNQEYRILKNCAKVLDLPQAKNDQFLGMDLCQPNIDFVQLATALGVKAHRVKSCDHLHSLVEESLHAEHATLIEVPVTG